MTEEGGEKDDDAAPPEAEPSNEPVDLDALAPEDDPVDLDQLAPEAEPMESTEPTESSTPQTLDDAARAQAMARKLAGPSGRRAALGRNPSTSSDATGSAAKIAIAAAKPTTTEPSQNRPGLAPAPTGSYSGGRRPLVDPSQKKQKPKREPFYSKIPRKPLVAAIAVAVLGVGGWFGWKVIDRSRHADEYAVRDELFQYKFDQSDDHFATIDAMGTKAVDIAIRFLTDPRPVETSFGKSTTTTSELAHMYLMHYAQRVGVDPPAKALDVVRLGGVRMKPNDWNELQDLWGKWFADVQAKGKAR